MFQNPKDFPINTSSQGVCKLLMSDENIIIQKYIVFFL